MISLGLTASEQREYEDLLLSSHWKSTIIRVLDLDHNYLGDISNRLITGQVNIDITAGVSRSLDVDLLDPSNTLGFDPGDPQKGDMFMDRMIQAWTVVQTPDRSKTFTCPVFTGPITKLDRNGSVVKVEAQGKEILSSQGVRSTRTYNTRWQKRTIISNLLTQTGEKKLNFAPRSARNTKPISLNRGSVPWLVAKDVARSMGMRLFYDGRGVAQLRPISSTSSYTFDGRSVLKAPEPGYDLNDVVNCVLVIGNRKRTKPRWVVAPLSSPFSPVRLGRGGKPRYFPAAEVNDSSIMTVAEQLRVGRLILDSGQRQSIDLAFESMPVPHLEEYDGYTYLSPEYSIRASVRTCSIPLTADGRMSMGALRRVTPNRITFRKA